MAEEVEGLDESEGAKASASAGARKKKMVMIGAAALLLLGGGGGGTWYMMHGGSDHGDAAEAEAESHGEAEEGGKPVYVEVPPMVINLRSNDGAQRFVKLRFVLVPGEGTTKEEVQDRLPAVLDAFQPFLRELRPEDLSGSAAVFRLKEEMLIRAGEALGRGKIRDILIQDLIQQ